ncbi:penicillin-binding protein [Geomicrobium sp. JCM 19038]|uniref:penicillin-binding protein n=1 Tax=Geomicrobium sp. JCM 19038 TaxID=1460635 RepID=UPI00045F1452|nr:penicillin-binding protein [Geomicrobium sp. JCM 19038]GAK07421.1 penicillin-binding protein [Geomicrobium sp. JCM 19038]
MKRTTIVYRALTVFAVAALFLAVIGGRFLYVQVAKGTSEHDYMAYAESQWTSEQPLHGERGTIYTSNGSAVAEEVSSYSVQAILKDDYGYEAVEDIDHTAEQLAPYIGLETNELRDMLQRGVDADRFQVELGSGSRQLTYEEKENIEDLELAGIEFKTEPRRYYPNQDFASHVVGYFDRSEDEPAMGLESSLDEYLLGSGGSYSYLRARNGVPLPGEAREMEEAYHGQDVYLTLHSHIQLAVEQALTVAETLYDPERMMAIVADPKTGEVLAMSNRPSFNPNYYQSISNHMNFTVSDHFEPGSTMKMFTMAAAIEEGVYDDEEYFQSGTYSTGYSDTPHIRDHNQGRGWGDIPYKEAMPRSANTAFARIVNDKLGADRFYEYMERFGFGRPTGIGLPMEASGLMSENDLGAIYSGFGQASAVTPIQQVQAATAIANGGDMVQPYLIDKIVNPNTGDVTYEHEPELSGQPISEETANQVKSQLRDVVYSDIGTGQPYQVEGIEVAGKTGTAQIPSEGGYLNGHNQNIFSFLGMAPYDDPELIVYVAVDRPNMPDGRSGNGAVAEIFNTVLKQSIQYLNLTSYDLDADEYQPEGIEVTDVTGSRINRAVEELQEHNLDAVVIGDGNRVEKQYPDAHEKVLAGEKIFLHTGGESIMPDFTGWSQRDVMKFGVVADLNIHVEGNGFAMNQSLEPGASLSGVETIDVAFTTDRSALDDEEESSPDEAEESSEESPTEEVEESQEEEEPVE